MLLQPLSRDFKVAGSSPAALSPNPGALAHRWISRMVKPWLPAVCTLPLCYNSCPAVLKLSTNWKKNQVHKNNLRFAFLGPEDKKSHIKRMIQNVLFNSELKEERPVIILHLKNLFYSSHEFMAPPTLLSWLAIYLLKNTLRKGFIYKTSSISPTLSNL